MPRAPQCYGNMIVIIFYFSGETHTLLFCLDSYAVHITVLSNKLTSGEQN